MLYTNVLEVKSFYLVIFKIEQLNYLHVREIIAPSRVYN